MKERSWQKHRRCSRSTSNRGRGKREDTPSPALSVNVSIHHSSSNKGFLAKQRFFIPTLLDLFNIEQRTKWTMTLGSYRLRKSTTDTRRRTACSVVISLTHLAGTQSSVGTAWRRIRKRRRNYPTAIVNSEGCELHQTPQEIVVLRMLQKTGAFEALDLLSAASKSQG